MRLVSLAFQPSEQNESDIFAPPQDHAFSLAKFEDTHKKATQLLRELQTHLNLLQEAGHRHKSICEELGELKSQEFDELTNFLHKTTAEI